MWETRVGLSQQTLRREGKRPRNLGLQSQHDLEPTLLQNPARHYAPEPTCHAAPDFLRPLPVRRNHDDVVEEGLQDEREKVKVWGSRAVWTHRVNRAQVIIVAEGQHLPLAYQTHYEPNIY